MEVKDLEASRDNSLNELEVKLQQELVALGRPDIASAIGAGRKYQRLIYAVAGALISYENLAGLRLAFDPQAAVPESKEAWIAEAKIQFADDTQFADVIAGYNEKLEEEKEKERQEKEKEKLEEEKKQADSTASSSPAQTDTNPTGSSGPAERSNDASNTKTAAGRWWRGVRKRVRVAVKPLQQWPLRPAPPPSVKAVVPQM